MASLRKETFCITQGLSDVSRNFEFPRKLPQKKMYQIIENDFSSDPISEDDECPSLMKTSSVEIDPTDAGTSQENYLEKSEQSKYWRPENANRFVSIHENKSNHNLTDQLLKKYFSNKEDLESCLGRKENNDSPAHDPLPGRPRTDRLGSDKTWSFWKHQRHRRGGVAQNRRDVRSHFSPTTCEPSRKRVKYDNDDDNLGLPLKPIIIDDPDNDTTGAFIRDDCDTLFRNKSENLLKDSVDNTEECLRQRNANRGTSTTSIVELPVAPPPLQQEEYLTDVDDVEYKNWLKKRDSNKKIVVCNRSTTSSVEEHIWGYYHQRRVSSERYSGINEVRRGYQKNDDEDKFEATANKFDFYQLITYEHIVILNFLVFFCALFTERKLKTLTTLEHTMQGFFFVFCYITFVLMKQFGDVYFKEF